MKPKKDLIDAAKSNGSINQMNLLLSAVQILTCEANSLMEEANDIMMENGLCIGLLKKMHKDFVRCADLYFKEFSTFVDTEECKMNMFSDLEDFDNSFRKWAKIPTGWKPKEVEP